MTHRSLLHELLAWTLTMLGLVWLVFMAAGFATGRNEADELIDGQLASVAALLQGRQAQAGANRCARPETGAAAPARLNPDEQHTHRDHDYQQDFSVMVWDRQGRLIERSGAAPVPRFDPAEGFATLTLDGPSRAWRSFTRWDGPPHQCLLMVLLPLDKRDRLAWDIGSQVAAPGLWLLPVAALVLGLAIRRGLRPLHELSGEVHALDLQRSAALPTAQRQQEFLPVVDAVNSLAQRYRSALANEQALASELAHELRTPLASLALHARTLQGELSTAQRTEALACIEHDALRAGHVVGQLLALARTDRAELAEAAQPLDLVELARDVIAVYAQTALERDHELALHAPEHFALNGHPVLLAQALRNLIDNALDHTPRGTLVEVQIDASARWLQVCDDGVRRTTATTPPDVTTAASTRARQELGLGLGLGLGHRIVGKIATLHGARFESVAAPDGFDTCYRLSF
jgi:two-component system sensor histidine kinase QseC